MPTPANRSAYPTLLLVAALCCNCNAAAPAPPPGAAAAAPPPGAGAAAQNPASPAATPASAPAAATPAAAAGAPGTKLGPKLSASDPGAGSGAPCAAAPVGMVCIPGGPAVIGADDRTAEEKPRHTVQLSTFYLDRNEVTNGDYKKCERAGECPSRAARIVPAYLPFIRPDLPVIPTTWDMAQAYCLFAGKRLPTEAEWEKAARGGAEGRTYPWGEEPPSCERSNFKGCPGALTKPVGSFPPGPYGIHDLAGNGYEWVHDWASDCFDGCPNACGPACSGNDPGGPCGGASPCKGHGKRLLKGGSWYWPGELGRGSWRRAQAPESGLHRLSFRCASSTNTLSRWPPLAKTDKLPPPPDPAPPTAKELAAFRDVVEDTDILAIPACRKEGEANPDCRDPMSYIKSNETGHHVWLPYIQNVGGAYVGLGSDQSYSFIAAARSSWAFIFDYDPAVVRVHQIVRAVVLDAKTPFEFVSAFAPGRAARTRELVRASLTDPAEREAADRTFVTVRATLWTHYFKSMQPAEFNKSFGWLRNKDYYAYVRLLFQQGRIGVLKGNMLTDKALPSIARAAKALGVPVRIYYPSNAEEQWTLPAQYKANVTGLPMDERSVVLRTLFSKRWGNKSQSYWHYVVHGGQHCQRTISRSGYDTVGSFMEDRRKTEFEMLSVIGLPARTAREGE